MKRVLLLKPGVTSSRALLGDYEVWFAARCGAQMTPVELHAGEAPPPPGGFDAVIMTGSPLSVTQPAEWMHRAADFLVEAAERVPVLGVCFGHQLLAWRLGARVLKNPLGRELGTVDVELTDAGAADPLFHGMPRVIAVQATHEDVVSAAPAGATLLARNTTCEVQAFAAGARLRAVQFHPEMDRESTRFCVRADRGLGDGERERRHAAVRDTPWGEHLLRNFLTRF